jgi:hypothetical protein
MDVSWCIFICFYIVSTPWLEARLSPGFGAPGSRPEGRGEVGGVGPPIPDGWAGGGVLGDRVRLPLLTAARPLTRPSQPRRGLLPRGHRALPQLQRAPVRRAQPAPALPRLADRRGPEQLLHLDGEDPPRPGYRREGGGGAGRRLPSRVLTALLTLGLAPGQIYTYPARCWRKKRRLNILEDPRLRPCEYKIGRWGSVLCLGWPLWVPTPLADQCVDALVRLSICLYFLPGPCLSDWLCLLVCVWG